MKHLHEIAADELDPIDLDFDDQDIEYDVHTPEYVYQGSLDEPFWKEISDKFPGYNDTNSDDHKKAVDWLYSEIRAWWGDDEELDSIEQELRDKISDGIT